MQIVQICAASPADASQLARIQIGRFAFVLASPCVIAVSWGSPAQRA
jgi:hypothetical protein